MLAEVLKKELPRGGEGQRFPAVGIATRRILFQAADVLGRRAGDKKRQPLYNSYIEDLKGPQR